MDDFSTITTELPRDRWGRPLITPPDGGDPVAYQRVTTFVGALEDTFHLNLWSQRMVALGMAHRRDLQLAAAAIWDPKDYKQKRTLNDIAKQAKDAAAAGAAATTGTALHSLTEVIDRGEEPRLVPEEYEADLAAYKRTMRLFRIVAIEGFCVVDSLSVGGSYDRILEFTAEGLDAYAASHGGMRLCYPNGEEVQPGDVVIGDLKTGASVELGMGKIAMQLGVYCNALNYDHTLGTRTPLPGSPRKDFAVVIHLPAGSGSAEALFVDIAAGWETARTIAPAVHAWRKRKDLASTFAAEHVTPATVTLTEQIHAAPTAEALRALWAENAQVWTPGLSELAKARIREIGG